MTSAPARAPWHGRILAFVGILLVALSLRTAVSAVSPILDHISRDIPLSAVIVSLLGAVPPVAFAVSGLLAPTISRRLGLDRALLLAIAVMVLGHLGRALAPSSGFLLVATIVTLVGVGTANVLLPPIVKRYFPDRIGLVSALYITAMSIGSSIPALIAVPVADTAGWRVSLGIWFAVAATAAVPWIGMLRRESRQRRGDAPTESELPEAEPALAARIIHSPVAWALVGCFGAGAFVTYSVFAWLPSILVDTAAVSPAGAGSLLALWALMGFPCGVLAPMLAVRLRSVTPLILASIVFVILGFGGFLLVPASAPALFTAFSGLGPLVFPLTLALINLRTRSNVGAVTLSGFVQGLAYAIGALGPIVVGLVRDATGSWSAPLLVILIVGVLLPAPALFVLRRPRFVEDELAASAERRARA